jgi:uncharacterized protein
MPASGSGLAGTFRRNSLWTRLDGRDSIREVHARCMQDLVHRRLAQRFIAAMTAWCWGGVLRHREFSCMLWPMKYVVIGVGTGASMDTIMAVYPRHKVLVDELVGRGEVIGIGPFSDRGNMGIFRTKEAAEEFVRRDPFNLEGLVKEYTVREWHDTFIL